VKQILRDTAGYKSVLGMEAVVTTPLDSPEAHQRLIEDVGDPRSQVALDCANMLEFGKDEEYPGAKAFIGRTTEKVGVKIYR